MTDYYQKPATPKDKRERDFDRLALLLLFLLLLAAAATLWFLRAPGGDDRLAAETVPQQLAAAPPTQAPAPEPQPEPLPAAEPAPEPEPVDAAPEPPPPLFSDARWRETARFTGIDSAGRSADFTAYVLVGKETWTFARADAILAGGLDEPVETAFANLNLGPGACRLTRVIAVGAASVEGTPERNAFLSRARGQALSRAIRSNLPCPADTVPQGVLDLGYNTSPVACPAGRALCPELSAPQRPIAMILAATVDPQTDIGEALRQGVSSYEASGGNVLPGARISDYSGFETAFDQL